MAATDRLTGKNLYVALIRQNGTVVGTTNLSGSQRSLSVEKEQEMVDATAGSDEYRVMIPTVKSIGASLSVVAESYSAGSAIFAAVEPGTAVGTLIWGPEGTATGKPKYGMVVRVQTSNQEIPFDDVYTVEVEFANAGSSLPFDALTGSTF